jgi:hypothetical protein
MGQRTIPRSDQAFSIRLGVFARSASEAPGRFAMSADDAAAVMAAATRLQAALQEARNPGSRSAVATREKVAARAEAERLYKRALDRLRVADGIDAAARMVAGMRERAERKRARVVPQEPPDMRFERALFGIGAAAPMHELSFRALGGTSKAKPDGAVRLELFVDLVRPDEEVPGHPGQNHGGRPWYLRSFSRSPIRITPPMTRVPMLVVYWGRWADAVGNVGPWCGTVVSRVEGHSRHVWMSGPGGIKGRVPVLPDAPSDAPEQKYSVAVRDAQYAYLNPQQLTDAEPVEPKQLEGPTAEAEAEAA